MPEVGAPPTRSQPITRPEYDLTEHDETADTRPTVKNRGLGGVASEKENIKVLSADHRRTSVDTILI